MSGVCPLERYGELGLIATRLKYFVEQSLRSSGLDCALTGWLNVGYALVTVTEIALDVAFADVPLVTGVVWLAPLNTTAPITTS